ncbi:hypothetical protein [Thioclava sp.]|uniref:hypothetical protein n=1 Tax=Thioclava sp. TaxID=1933450 RepID=UPI003AA7D90E
MNEFLHILQDHIAKEAVGLIGGVIFFGSWMWQAWQSRQARTPVVTQSFFAMRATASALLTVEGIRTKSLSITLVMAATLLLMLYNIYLIRKRARRAAHADQTG